MHSLLSIIHLLLVLTQNRIMPEMQAIWKAVTTEISDQNVIHKDLSIQAPIERSRFLRVEAIDRIEKEKVPPISNSLIPRQYSAEKTKVAVLRRPSGSTKRYLVFCQMKADG